jgi:hypothetical protein
MNSDNSDMLVTLAGTLSNLDPFAVCDGDLGTLVERMTALQVMQQTIRSLQEQLHLRAADLMPQDTVDLPGRGVLVRQARTRKVWRDDVTRADMMEAARNAIARQVATDPMTGEILMPLKGVAMRTFDLVEQAFSLGSDPKVAFRRVLGLDPTDFRAELPAGTKVEFMPLEVSGG